MCTSPNRVFYWQRGPDLETKFCFGEKVHHLELDSQGHISCSYDSCVLPSCQRVIRNYYTVGCGKCMECKLQRAKQRSDRMIMETLIQGDENAWFVTLTYDNYYMPVSSYTDIDGVIHSVGNLDKSDLQKFFKRLRKALSGNNTSSFRYVACGEYGDVGARPHYHFIGWNLPLNDLKLDTELSETGQPQWTSEFLEKLWSFGRVRVSNVEQGSIAYVARYVQKKAYGDEATYKARNLEPPFILQSKGIGKEYLLAHQDKLLYEGRIFTSLVGEPVELNTDRYFEKLLIKEGIIDEDTFSDKKALWADLRDAKIQNQLSLTSDGYEEFQEKRNNQLLCRTKTLKRNGDF